MANEIESKSSTDTKARNEENYTFVLFQAWHGARFRPAQPRGATEKPLDDDAVVARHKVRVASSVLDLLGSIYNKHLCTCLFRELNRIVALHLNFQDPEFISFSHFSGT
jgi:hypothetical protein